VTYVDADLWLLRSPAPVFAEIEAAGRPVLITRHGFAPEHDQSASSGRFCVQFMTFTFPDGEVVRQWWEDRCIEWCYARHEDNKFGDQKYLDDWPERFPDLVHVLEHQEWALGPWNATRFPYSDGVFYHFHGLRIGEDRRVHLGGYPLPPVLVRHVYQPYAEALGRSLAALARAGVEVRPQRTAPTAWSSLTSRLALLGAERWRLGVDHTLRI
jgi:hypothetical protein